jgi:hypothetical protein
MRSDCCDAVLISPAYVAGGDGIRIAVKLIESAALFGTASGSPPDRSSPAHHFRWCAVMAGTIVYIEISA